MADGYAAIEAANAESKARRVKSSASTDEVKKLAEAVVQLAKAVQHLAR